MAWMIVKIILGVLILAALFTWAIVWYVQASTSKDERVHHRAELVNSLLAIGIATICSLSAWNQRGARWALVLCGLVRRLVVQGRAFPLETA
ncbi:MAG: hypothetical protein WA188_02280 [Terriglobales bacterium]